jgi:hypothetical protein
MSVTLEEFVAAAFKRADLTGMRLLRNDAAEDERPRASYAGVFSREDSPDAVAAAIEKARRQAPTRQHELRAAFATAPTERLPLEPLEQP